MSATRKILLVLSILVALLGLFRVYDLTMSGSMGSLDRDRARNKAELTALEAGEPPPNGVKLDEQQRAARIADLRAWVERGEEQAACEGEYRQAAWRNTIGMLVLAGGLAAAVVVMGRKDGPRALVRLGRLRPGVVIAVVIGLIAGSTLIGFTQDLIEEQEELTLAERRLDEVQRKLKSGFDFDANGNIPPQQRVDFELTLSEAKYAPERVVSARGRRTVDVLIILASTVVLGLCAYFGRRSWVRSFANPDPRPSAS